MLTTILGLAIIALLLLILLQLGRASELSNLLYGEAKVDADGQEQMVSDKNNRLHATLFMLFLVFGMIATFWSTWYFSDKYLPSPASIQGQWWENLFYWTLVATVPIFVITHVLLFGFAFKYRGRKGNKSFYYPHNNKLELIWTAIPSAVLVLLVYQGIQEWLKITGWAPTKDEAVVVEATGKQFMWDLRYAGTDNVLGKKAVKLISGDNSFGMDWKDPTSHDDFSATELHLPVDKQVLVKVNALDVLHCFALPHFVVKIDAVPGIPTEVWFTPIKTTAQMRAETGNPDFNYELACMELCGAGHYNMRRVVVVETQDEFNKWFKDQKSIYAGAKTSEAKTTAENNIIPPDTKPASSTTAEPAKVASGH